MTKLKKSKSKLLFFTLDGKHYSYETIDGYSFQAKTKCGNTVNLFVYKLNNKWNVNDNEGLYATIVTGQNTRKRAIEMVCNRISKVNKEKFNEASKILLQKRKEKMKGRTEKKVN